ncbi:MAG TPA: DinB family protein [Hanamia sp.]|nr:DinB family protein [Hanamia sp.]
MKYTPEDGFPYYFDFVKDMDYKSLFTSSSTLKFLNSITEGKAKYRYAPNKWSIKQMIGHITDHERIKIYRAFLMSRNESVQLWGYDQNFLVDNSHFEELTFQKLVTDFANVRQASGSFVDTLSKSQLEIKGWLAVMKLPLNIFLNLLLDMRCTI